MTIPDISKGMVWYNGCMMNESIVSARMKCGLSQRELARRLGMKPAQLCKLERGKNVPENETLSRIALALDLPVGALMGGRDESPDVSAYIPVRLDCMAQGGVRTAVERTERRIWSILDARRVCAATTLPLVHAYLEQPHAGEILARALRDAMGVGTAALADLFGTLEYENVFIHRMGLPEGMQSGSWWNGKREALTVVVSEDDTAERQTFRLAYELGSACLFRSCDGGPIRETKREHRFLGEFAADFLMPASAVADRVAKAGIGRRDWTFDRLCLFKAHFGVSAEAFAFRLEELGLIDKAVRRTLRDELRAYYKSHPKNKEPNPMRLPQIGTRWKVME